VVLPRSARGSHDDQYRACLFVHTSSVMYAMQSMCCFRTGTTKAVGTARNMALLAQLLPCTNPAHQCAMPVHLTCAPVEIPVSESLRLSSGISWQLTKHVTRACVLENEHQHTSQHHCTHCVVGGTGTAHMATGSQPSAPPGHTATTHSHTVTFSRSSALAPLNACTRQPPH
jgi:hypothetical protein